MEQIQSWLTPALLSAAVVLVGILLHSISVMRKDLRTALEQIVRHETILHQNGLTEPRFLNFGKHTEGGGD